MQQVWNMSPTRENDLSDLSCLLPYLRQLLTCCACAGLLDNAMISISCGHCYCCQCQYKDPLLKIQCRQCRDRTGLVVETQLRIVVECYKHVCFILADKVKDDPNLLKRLIAQDQTADKTIEKTDVLVDENESSEKCSKKNKQKNFTSLAKDNPIFEILGEILDGVKVSRGILVIKPPQKYLAPRIQTPRKELHTLSVSTKVSKPKPKCAVNLTSNLSSKKLDTPQERQKTTPLGNSTLVSQRISSLRRKRKRKVVLKNRSVPSSSNRDKVSRKRRRVRRISVELSSEEEDEVVDVLGLPNSKKPQRSEEDMLISKLALDCFEKELYSVSFACLDSQHLHVTPDGVSLKQNSKQSPFDSNVAFKPDDLSFKQSEDGSRERLWSHMCPRLKARRSRAIIDKTIIQQEKVAHGAIKTKAKEIKIKTPKKKTPPKPAPLLPFTPPPPPPPPTLEYEEPPLPDDLSGLVLEKFEGEDPLPYIDRLLFRPPPPPVYHHPLTPHFHHMPPLPPPPHFRPGSSPLFGPLPPPGSRFPLLIPPPPLPVSPLKQPPAHFTPIPKTPMTKSPSTPRKRRTPGYSEDGWRCRCGTNNVMFPEKVCAKGKCPCFSKGIPCKNCLCKHCHNPNNK